MNAMKSCMKRVVFRKTYLSVVYHAVGSFSSHLIASHTSQAGKRLGCSPEALNSLFCVDFFQCFRDGLVSE